MKYKTLLQVIFEKKGGWLLLLTAALFLTRAPLTVQAADNSEKKLQVYTVNYPLAYFAQRIAAGNADVFFPAPPGEDPAYWMPNAKTIAKYQKADLILLNGANYAKWVAKVSLPRSKMVDTSKKFKDRYIYTKGDVTHSHGPQGKHAHENLAFTTWLDLSLAADQAKAVQDAMARKRPDLTSLFQENFKLLYQDLTDLDSRLKQVVSSSSEKPVVVSHPVYDYMATRYGMNIKSLHWEPDQKPDEGQWPGLKSILKNHPAKWLIWEAIPIQDTVDRLESVGIESCVVSPCANRPEKGDFMTVMITNLKSIEKVYD